MSSLKLSDDTMKKIVCHTCKNYLSYFPIYLKSDNSGGICGRCEAPDDGIRDEAYENIAHFLVFPCQYQKNGCTEQLTPPNIKKHEPICDYLIFDCPSKPFSTCQWKGTHSDMTGHFSEKHPDSLLNEPRFELKFVSSYRENVLLPFNKELFVVKREVDARSEKFICSVQHLSYKKDAENYNYFLRLVNADGTYSCKLTERSTDEDNNVSKFTRDDVKKTLNNPVSIIVQIEICKAKVVLAEAGNSKQIEKDPSVPWELLSELECPVCFCFMLPPIFQCTGGHSMCSDCKPQLAKCPLCLSPFQETKNFALEKVASYLTFPCKFYKEGCTYTSKGAEIRQHEASCEFGPCECPAIEIAKCDCKVERVKLLEHIQNNHDDLILKSDKIDITFKKTVGKELYYLIIVSGKIFKLCFKYNDEKFYWAVQLLGSKEEVNKFKFEINIVDYSGDNLSWCLKALCGPPTKNADCFTNSRYYLMVVYDQIASLIMGTFSFQVRIVSN